MTGRPLLPEEAESYRHIPFTGPVPIPGQSFDTGDRFALCANGAWWSVLLGAAETLLNRDTWKGQQWEQEAAVQEATRMLASLYRCGGTDLTDCCDPILERLDLIVSLLDGMAGPARFSMYQTIENMSINAAQPGAPQPGDFYGGTTAQGLWESFTWNYPQYPAGNPPEVEAMREEALCSALYMLMTSIGRSAYDTLLGGGFSLGSTLAGLGFWIPGALTFIGAGLSAAIVEAVFTAENIAAFVCCWMDEYKTYFPPLTKGDFDTVADLCAAPGNMFVLSNVAKAHLADPINWGAFMHDLGRAYDVLEAGGSLGCPCIEEGEECTPGGTPVGIDLELDGSDGLMVDQNLGSCPSFGTTIGGGMDFQGTGEFCLQTWGLMRFFGGRNPGEATVARLTINGATFDEPIGEGHCIITLDPPQVLHNDEWVRVDLLGGSGSMCMTGVRFTGTAIT